VFESGKLVGLIPLAALARKTDKPRYLDHVCYGRLAAIAASTFQNKFTGNHKTKPAARDQHAAGFFFSSSDQ
jgi:hypothetical protein